MPIRHFRVVREQRYSVEVERGNSPSFHVILNGRIPAAYLHFIEWEQPLLYSDSFLRECHLGETTMVRCFGVFCNFSSFTLLECSEGCCFKCMFIMDGFPLSQSACTLFEESIVFFQRERGKTVHSRRLSPNRTFLLRLWTCFLDRLKKKVRSRRLFMTSQKINVLLWTGGDNHEYQGV